MTDSGIRYVYQPPPYPVAPAPAGSPETSELLPHEKNWLMSSTSRILRGDPLVAVLRRLTASGRAPAFADVSNLLPILWSASPAKWRARTVLCWMLGRWKVEDSDRDRAAHALCAILHGARQGAMETPAARAAILAVLLSGMVLLPSIGFQGTRLPGGLVTLAVIWSIAILALLPGYRSGDQHNRRVEKRIAIAALGRLGVVESIPVIAHAAAGKDSDLYQVADQALEKTLPLLTPDHYGRLSAELVDDLCRLLGQSRSVNELTILNALEKIGDGRAIPSVKRVAHYFPQHNERALEVLAVLEARAKEASEPYRLLRPTESVEKETLLRTAKSNQSEVDQPLLRPSDPHI